MVRTRLAGMVVLLYLCALVSALIASPPQPVSALDRDLVDALSAAGFTGMVQQTYQARIEANLGRPIDPRLAEIGRMLWFDTLHSLHADNTCGGCHSPTNGFGDSQPMAIGVQNNGLVGPHRTGPRNQRRSPLVINTALYPALMWNGRFSSLSGDPFDNSRGFRFPFPEADERFSHDNDVAHGLTHLLQAQAHMPPTELIEVAGFTGTCAGGIADATLGPAFCQFDDDLGESVPAPDPVTGSRNQPIRQKVLDLLNDAPAYRQLFGDVFPEVRQGAAIDFFMFGKAIAEFEFTLVFADAPLDQFARGNTSAMSPSQKRGALLFFGSAGCVNCHTVAGASNEMFSDFAEHVIGVPQIAPVFGAGTGNVMFAGKGADEDFGLEEITGDRADRYKFRTAPLRNLAVAPGYFHNGAFTDLADAIHFHLNVIAGSRTYDALRAGVPTDLAQRVGPPVPVKLLDPAVRGATPLDPQQLDDLVAFVRDALHDPRVNASTLCRLVPAAVPSGRPVLQFEACR
jgi:cytochrome c peroxidase